MTHLLMLLMLGTCMRTTATIRGGDSEECEYVNQEVFMVQIVGANEITLRYVRDVCHNLVRQADLASVSIYSTVLSFVATRPPGNMCCLVV